jgi:hypothetical protein
VIDGMTKWIHGWKKKGWVNASKQPVRNADLWHELIEAARATGSNGNGCAATTATRKTNGSTSLASARGSALGLSDLSSEADRRFSAPDFRLR